MAYKYKQGWYKIINEDKFKKPIDEHMQSYKDGYIQYKSSLELKAFKYADYNKHIVAWSIEPFPIYYIKPTDNKYHRYFIDLFLEFKTGDKFLVEIKPFKQTFFPKEPKSKEPKSLHHYQNALMTYAINQAKWKAARQFAKEKNLRFIILTEKELN